MCFDETLVVEQVGKQSNRSVVVADGGHEREPPCCVEGGKKSFQEREAEPERTMWAFLALARPYWPVTALCLVVRRASSCDAIPNFASICFRKV
jgi:hypothetical protein